MKGYGILVPRPTDSVYVLDLKRLGRYGLTLHPTKTRFIDFRPQAVTQGWGCGVITLSLFLPCGSTKITLPSTSAASSPFVCGISSGMRPGSSPAFRATPKGRYFASRSPQGRTCIAVRQIDSPVGGAGRLR